MTVSISEEGRGVVSVGGLLAQEKGFWIWTEWDGFSSLDSWERQSPLPLSKGTTTPPTRWEPQEALSPGDTDCKEGSSMPSSQSQLFETVGQGLRRPLQQETVFLYHVPAERIVSRFSVILLFQHSWWADCTRKRYLLPPPPLQKKQWANEHKAD
jgi:hypothetical protein